jgi:hypothetical protein
VARALVPASPRENVPPEKLCHPKRSEAPLERSRKPVLSEVEGDLIAWKKVCRHRHLSPRDPIPKKM